MSLKLSTYRYVATDFPRWEPLEWAAERSAKLAGSPTIDPDPFAYAGHLVAVDGGPDLHLYKQYVTRRYLNVDDAHRVFAFMWAHDAPDRPYGESEVHYMRLRGLAEALDLLAMHLVDPDDQWRSRRIEPAGPLTDDIAGTGNVIPLGRAPSLRARRR